MGLDLVELVMAYEEEFRITIPNAAAERMATPGDVIDHIMIQLRERGEQPDRANIANTVREITLEQLGVRPKHYREDARFIEDFGAD
jgi:acyl carrier protein